MQSTIQDYNNKYAEEACLGRGAFGQAMLASLRSDPSKKVVAKKVILEGLGEREKQNCISEANLLKHLQHPNIVSFIESYISEDQLIIVLEYCEGKPRGFRDVYGSRRPELPRAQKDPEKGALQRAGGV